MILWVPLTTVKATVCEVFKMAWRDHKKWKVLFHNTNSQNLKQIKYFSTFVWSLDEAKILRTHRWRGCFNPVSHSTCFSDCRMHQKVLISPWKEACRVQLNLLILQECSSISHLPQIHPKYWCKNMTSRGESTQIKKTIVSGAFLRWWTTNPYIVYQGALIDWFVVQLYRGGKGRNYTVTVPLC